MQENLRENKDIGRGGENLATDHLIRNGFDIVARNVSYKTGEIDIVAKRGNELHFVEVKTRTGTQMVSPLESITEIKKRRMRRTAQWYLTDSRNNFKDNNLPQCYFSVIGIEFIDGKPKIECILDAFV
ncbi:MAG: YraN family protein [Pseudomonadota bacterium]